MDAERNKIIMRRWFLEAFSQGQLDLVDELTTDDYENHDPYEPPGGFGRGPAAAKALMNLYRSAFPDVQFTIVEQVAEGDQVVTRWTATGANTGPLMGMPPTGRRIHITGISIDRMVNGKSAQTWANWDMFGMMQQLGVIPPA